ncbi:MAG: MFS transporter [Chloroflexi bacterium]|nr:MFS transporter [Chloroflexota bacterium]
MNATQKNLRTFYAIIGTQTLSIIGSRLSGLAVGFEVFRQTGQATPLLLVSLFSLLPNIFAANIGGVLADRWDRRKLMLVADAGQALCSLLLLISFASGSFQIWHLYVLVIVGQVLASVQGPAFMASITMLVPDEQRDRANALTQLSGPLAGIIAPILSGLLYAAIGVVGTIAIDLATFAAAAMVFMFVHIPMPSGAHAEAAAKDGVWRSFTTGFGFLWSRKPMLVLVMQFALVNFCIGGAMGLEMAYTVSRTGSEQATGLILGVSSVGGLIGGIIMSVWGGTRPRIHTIMPALIMGGTFLALFGLAQSTLWLSVTVFLMMFPIAFVNAPVISILQNKTPPELQGRVFAVLSQISIVLMPIAYLLFGYLADNVLEPAVGTADWARYAPLFGSGQGSGMAVIFFACGVLMTVSSVLAYMLPMVRKMEATLPDYEAQATPDSETGTADETREGLELAAAG